MVYNVIKNSPLRFAYCVALLSSSQIIAAPWIDTSDRHLRADIQLLADYGLITVPVNTYPLMWFGIANDLAQLSLPAVPAELQPALHRVQLHYKRAQQSSSAMLEAAAASDSARFQQFGNHYREQYQLTGAYEHLSNRLSVKISVNALQSEQGPDQINLDGSYISVLLGNWALTTGRVSQWWGPGVDTALHKSTNARPMPSVMLTRVNSAAFASPWLAWIGPWTFTTSVSQMEQHRAIAKPLVWSSRGSFRPLQQLEIAASWSMQFCGEGQPCQPRIWWQAITGGVECANGETDCDSAHYTKKGNQLAGFDVRYSDQWFGLPVALYWERTCEDASGRSPLDIADCANLFGVDSRVSLFDQSYKVYAEYSNTLVACGEDLNHFNCFYEHTEYLNGFRYHGRSLGSTYDSDAKVWVLGAMAQYSGGRALATSLRYARLNVDGQNTNAPYAPQTAKEDVLMLELAYQLPLWRGLAEFGGSLSKSTFAEQTTSHDGRLFAQYKYAF